MPDKPAREFDVQVMRAAIELARPSRPSPNPPVGAVVVSADGQTVASARHEEAGAEHAEALALRAAGERASGGTLFVTLEPCNHEGKTPRCVDAILASRVARVVVGCVDPNPHVTGGGAKRLEEAGVVVDVGTCGPEARALIAPWTKFITTGLPFTGLKLALSLDGRIATRSGESKWVTGPEARAKVQELRANHDAAVIGIGAALADDPRLTVRDEALLTAGRPPTRIVLDTRLRLPITSRLATTASEVPTWVVTGVDAPESAEHALVDKGCGVLRVAMTAEGRIDVTAALRAVAEQGVVSVLIEGGAELAGSVLAARLADELHAFLAPLLLGPRGRPGAVDWAGPDTLTDAPRILEPRWEVCGRDAYVRGALQYAERRP